jgi:hypothetical protein
MGGGKIIATKTIRHKVSRSFSLCLFDRGVPIVIGIGKKTDGRTKARLLLFFVVKQ